MLAVLCAAHDPVRTVLAVEEAFRGPRIDPETREILEHDLVGSLDRLERDADGRLTVVDLRTAARRYTALPVEASLQLSVHSYAAAMNGLSRRGR
jgi:RecB family exonuclease